MLVGCYYEEDIPFRTLRMKLALPTRRISCGTFKKCTVFRQDN